MPAPRPCLQPGRLIFSSVPGYRISATVQPAENCASLTTAISRANCQHPANGSVPHGRRSHSVTSDIPCVSTLQHGPSSPADGAGDECLGVLLLRRGGRGEVAVALDRAAMVRVDSRPPPVQALSSPAAEAQQPLRGAGASQQAEATLSGAKPARPSSNPTRRRLRRQVRRPDRPARQAQALDGGAALDRPQQDRRIAGPVPGNARSPAPIPG